MAFIWAFFIPHVRTSLYFNRNVENPSDSYLNQMLTAFNLIWMHFKASYTNKMVILWSFYYAIALCFYIQITAYIQVLWIHIDNTQEVIYNGAVDAILTLLGAGVSILAGKIQINFLKSKIHTLLVLIVISSVQGAFVILAAQSHTLLSCYIFYISYGVAYAFGITICATEIAKNLVDDTFGLVFGFNTLIALVVQTGVTLSVVSSGFKLSPCGQYYVYGYGYVILSVIYLLTLSYDVTKTSMRS